MGRAIGAVVGALLGVVAIATAVAIDAVIERDPLQSVIATVFTPGGMANGDPGSLALAWSVGPIAAALAGVGFAGLALRGVDGVGLWMGAVTYVGAILLAPIVFVPDVLATQQGIGDVVSAAVQLPILWILSGLALGPLLGVCLIAGPIWAMAVRRLAPAGTTSTASLPIWPVVVFAVLIGIGWAFATWTMNAISSATFD